MSDHGFHVHGPHDHELEHAAHSSIDSFAGKLAVATAVLATIGSIFSFMSGATESDALRYENDAAIRRTEAAGKWAVALTANSKLHLAQLATELVPESRKAHFEQEAQRHAAEVAAAKESAERLDAEAIRLDTESDELLRRHHRWAQATTLLQIAIAMAAIALLSRRRWLLIGVFGLGAIGSVLGALAWIEL